MANEATFLDRELSNRATGPKPDDAGQATAGEKPDAGQRVAATDRHDDAGEANYAEWRRTLGEWLAGFHWQAYATLTFRVPATYATAATAAQSLLAALGPAAYGYIAYERGLAGGRTHMHALLGGLVVAAGDHYPPHDGFPHLAVALQRVATLWHRGNVKIERYNPRRGAAWYLAKFPESGEILGSPRRHHRRARRR